VHFVGDSFHLQRWSLALACEVGMGPICAIPQLKPTCISKMAVGVLLLILENLFYWAMFCHVIVRALLSKHDLASGFSAPAFGSFAGAVAALIWSKCDRMLFEYNQILLNGDREEGILPVLLEAVFAAFIPCCYFIRMSSY
jgi:hypothetical protein